MALKDRLPRSWSAAARVVAPPNAPRVEPPPLAAEPQRCKDCDAELPAGAKYCPQCGAKVEGQGDAGGGDAAAHRSFAKHALTMTGAKNLEAARGTLESWKESADQLAAANARVQHLEREQLLEHAVHAGVLLPEQAWAFAEKDGKKARDFSEWAGPFNAATKKGQSLEQLKGYLEQRTAATPAGPRASTSLTPASRTTPEAQLTDEDREHCRRSKLDPNIYAERKYGAKGAGEGRK